MDTNDIAKLYTEAFSAAGMDLLGYMIGWTNNVARQQVRCDDLRAAAVDAGLDPDKFPATIEPESAMRRAVAQICRRHKVAAEITTDTPGVLVWSFVDTTVPDDAQVGDAVGTLQNRIAFNRVDGTYLAEQDSAMTQDMAELFDRFTNYINGKDLRDAIHRLLADWKAIRLWGQGGWYFVRAEYAQQILALQQVMSAIGNSAGAIPVPAFDPLRDQFGAQARDQVVQAVQGMRDEVAKWRSADGSAPRTSTLQRRIDQYHELRSDLVNLAAILNLQTKQIEADMSQLEGDVRAMIAGAAAVDTPNLDRAKADADQADQDSDSSSDDQAHDDSGDGAAQDAQDAHQDDDAAAVDADTPDTGNGQQGAADEAQDDDQAPAPTPPARPVAPTPDLDAMTVRELKRLARQRGLDVRGMRTKDALVGALTA